MSKTKHGLFIISRQAQPRTTEKPKQMKVRSSLTCKRCPVTGWRIPAFLSLCSAVAAARLPPQGHLMVQENCWPWHPLSTLLGQVGGRRVHHPSHPRRPLGGPQNTLAKIFLSRNPAMWPQPAARDSRKWSILAGHQLKVELLGLGSLWSRMPFTGYQCQGGLPLCGEKKILTLPATRRRSPNTSTHKVLWLELPRKTQLNQALHRTANALVRKISSNSVCGSPVQRMLQLPAWPLCSLGGSLPPSLLESGILTAGSMPEGYGHTASAELTSPHGS